MDLTWWFRDGVKEELESPWKDCVDKEFSGANGLKDNEERTVYVVHSSLLLPAARVHALGIGVYLPFFSLVMVWVD